VRRRDSAHMYVHATHCADKMQNVARGTTEPDGFENTQSHVDALVVGLQRQYDQVAEASDKQSSLLDLGSVKVLLADRPESSSVATSFAADLDKTDLSAGQKRNILKRLRG
jgi:hypothetical protein